MFELISTKKKKPHIIRKELILPVYKEIVIMFGKEADEQISDIPMSNDTVCRRILTMSEDIVKNVNEKLQENNEFAVQLDESTEVNLD